MSFDEKIAELKATLEKTGLKIANGAWGLRIEDTEENRVYVTDVQEIESSFLNSIDYKKVV